jgi:hypothetical protein
MDKMKELKDKYRSTFYDKKSIKRIPEIFVCRKD